MVLPINTESDDYRFLKTLNMDVELQPISNISNHWDIQMDNGDYVNLTGTDSLCNAICIAIMTRYNELSRINLYDGFGCRIHELIKANKSEMVKYKVKVFTEEVLENMRRVKEVQYIEITEPKNHHYRVFFNIISITDEIVTGSVEL